jgi:hypothetical protein
MAPLELDAAVEELDAAVVEELAAVVDDELAAVVVLDDEEAMALDEVAWLVVVKAPAPVELDPLLPPAPVLLPAVVNDPVVLSRPCVENPHAPPKPNAKDAARSARHRRLFSMPSIIAHLPAGVSARQRQKDERANGKGPERPERKAEEKTHPRTSGAHARHRTVWRYLP